MSEPEDSRSPRDTEIEKEEFAVEELDSDSLDEVAGGQCGGCDSCQSCSADPPDPDIQTQA